MQDGRNLRAPPSLIEPDVGDDVRDQEAGILPCVIVGSRSRNVWERGGAVSDIDDGMREERVVLYRDRRAYAVAQELGIAVGVHADAGIILINKVGLIGVLRRVEEVVERRRLAEGEAAELDEGAQQISIAV